MDVEAQPVPDAVHVEVAIGAAVNQPLGSPAQQPEIDESARDHFDGCAVGRIPARTGADHRQGRLLRGQYHVVDRPLPAAEAAADGKTARDVGGVATVFAAGVNQHQVAPAQSRRVARVVHGAGPCSSGDDARIGRGPGAVTRELVEQLGLELILVQPGATLAHGPPMGRDADCSGATKLAQLRRRLEQTQLVNEEIEIRELPRR